MRNFWFLYLILAAFAACKSSNSGQLSKLSYQELVANSDHPIKINANRPWLDVLEPEVLIALEHGNEHGYTLAELFSYQDWGVYKKRAHNLDLVNNSPLYNSLKSYLDGLIDRHKAEYYVASQGDYTETSSFADNPRSFSSKWLSSSSAHFELIAVVNRVDRRDMRLGDQARRENCGEVRFVYRLAYQVNGSRSRLPFTVNVVFESIPEAGVSEASCAAYAASLKTPSAFTKSGAYAQWLQSSVLDLSQGFVFRQVELNFQIVRLTSGLKKELGGHAEYILAVLKKDGKKLVPAKLENQPDPKLLASSPALKKELVDYLSRNLDLIDSGNLKLPEKFLATEAVSISTHGSARKRNQPYLRFLTEEDLRVIDFEKSSALKSPAALLTRLNDMTCTGCHQGRSVAGFHLFGFESEQIANPFNQIHVGFSEHYAEEKKRRNSYVWRLAVDQQAPGQFEKRYLSFQPTKNQAASGLKIDASCLGQDLAEKNFKGHLAESLTCGSGLSCEVLSKNSVLPLNFGLCLNRQKSLAGSACLAGDLDESGRTRLDTMSGNSQIGCASEGVNYRCLRPFQGTPSGMCIADCVGMEQRKPGEICAYNANANFEACAAQNDFSRCQNLTGKRSLRQACDTDNHCREDYICQKIFSVSGSPVPLQNQQGQAGFCAPVYFIFQMRLDGHPVDKI